MSPAMAKAVDELLGASTNLSSESSKLVADAGRKLKRLVACEGMPSPTRAAGEGEREPAPRPLPRQGSCRRSMGVVEKSLVERDVRCSVMKLVSVKMSGCGGSSSKWTANRHHSQGEMKRMRHQ